MSEVRLGAGALVVEDGEVLLIKEAKDYVENQWNLPSGGHEEGETLRETAIREFKEETGVKIELNGVIGIYTRQSEENPDWLSVLVVFEGSTVTKDPEPEKTDEIAAAEWVDLDEVEDLDKRFDWERILDDYNSSGSCNISIEHLEIT